MQHLKLKFSDKSSEADGIDIDEMVVLAASLDDSQDLDPGDLIWAKLTGMNPGSFALHLSVSNCMFNLYMCICEHQICWKIFGIFY